MRIINSVREGKVHRYRMWQKMLEDPMAVVLLTAAGIAVLRRLTLWRSIRGFIYPVIAAGLIYRYQVHAPSLFDLVKDALAPCDNVPDYVSYILRDAVGLFLLVSLSNFFLCVLSPIGKPIKTAVMDWGYSLVQVMHVAIVVGCIISVLTLHHLLTGLATRCRRRSCRRCEVGGISRTQPQASSIG